MAADKRAATVGKRPADGRSAGDDPAGAVDEPQPDLMLASPFLHTRPRISTGSGRLSTNLLAFFDGPLTDSTGPIIRSRSSPARR
jgi:hypothetical protein